MDFGNQKEERAMKCYIAALLIKQAQSDQAFAPLEKRYLEYANRTLRLSAAELAAVQKDPEAFVISPPPDEAQRMTILYYLLFMMKADKLVELEEEKLCHEVGFRMGFRREMITNLITLMRECLHGQIPPGGMLERIRPYLN